jgi:hypothetical protein
MKPVRLPFAQARGPLGIFPAKMRVAYGSIHSVLSNTSEEQFPRTNT